MFQIHATKQCVHKKNPNSFSPHPCCTFPFHSHRQESRTLPTPADSLHLLVKRRYWTSPAGPQRSLWPYTGNREVKKCEMLFFSLKKWISAFFLLFTWSPKACLPIVMGTVQPGTSRGMFLQRIGSRKTVPPRMFLMVPFGLFHIFFSLNSDRT